MMFNKYNSLLLVFLISPVMADIYKCPSPNGKITYTQKPCPKGLKQSNGKWKNAAKAIEETKNKKLAEEEKLKKQSYDRVSQIIRRETERENRRNNRGLPLSDPEVNKIFNVLKIAFVGSHSKARIKSKLEKVMRLYQTPITIKNYNGSASSLVALRKNSGISEMNILNKMIIMYVEGSSLSFAEGVGLATAFYYD